MEESIEKLREKDVLSTFYKLYNIEIDIKNSHKIYLSIKDTVESYLKDGFDGDLSNVTDIDEKEKILIFVNVYLKYNLSEDTINKINDEIDKRTEIWKVNMYARNRFLYKIPESRVIEYKNNITDKVIKMFI